MCVYVYVYVCVYLCVYMCVCVCVYIYMCVCTHVYNMCRLLHIFITLRNIRAKVVSTGHFCVSDGGY